MSGLFTLTIYCSVQGLGLFISLHDEALIIAV